MPNLHTILHSVLFLLAGAFFILMSWVSFKFFVVEDPGSRLGKRAISVTAGGTAILVLWVLGSTKWPSSGGTLLTQLLATTLYLYALTLFCWAWRANRQQPLDFIGSNRPPRHLNQSGPYARVRHPFYSAYCASWIASVLATQAHGVVTVMGGLLLAVYISGARREERLFAEGDLGAQYRAYVSAVPMLIPKFRLKVA